MIKQYFTFLLLLVISSLHASEPVSDCATLVSQSVERAHAARLIRLPYTETARFLDTNGDMLLVGSKTGSFRWISLDDGTTRDYQPQAGAITQIIPLEEVNGLKVLTIADNHTAWVRNLFNNKTIKLEETFGDVYAAVPISPSELFVLGQRNSGIYNIDSRKVEQTLHYGLLPGWLMSWLSSKAQDHIQGATQVGKSPDGYYSLSTESFTQNFWFWDVNGNFTKSIPDNYAHEVVVSEKRGLVLTISRQESINAYNLHKYGSFAFQLNPPRSLDALLTASFFPDANRIVTGSANGHTEIWGAYSGQLLGKVTARQPYIIPESTAEAPVRASSPVISTLVHPNGLYGITLHENGTLSIWETRFFTVVRTIDLGAHVVGQAQFSENGKKILIPTLTKKPVSFRKLVLEDNGVEVWDWEKLLL